MTDTPAPQDRLLRLVLESLDDDQAQDVVTIPLAGKSTIADYMVIATGRSTRQVASMAQKIGAKVHEAFRRPVRTEGLAAADWVLLDAGDVIVHLFRPEVRTFYNLERMWQLDPPAAEAMRPQPPPERGTLRLHILARGRIARTAEGELVDRYLARIPWPTPVTELGEAGPFPPAPPRSVRIVLDERGEQLGSDDLAARLGRWRDEGVREAQFLLGAADGHEDGVRAAADLLLAFGRATWPHLLARAMLAEQLYRAVSILSGHPYHRAG